MSLLPDWRIRRDVKIEPFAEEAKRPGKISYGLSSYGYDIRVGYKFKIFTPTNCAVVDPKNFDPKSFVDVDITPGHQWKLGSYYMDQIEATCIRCNLSHAPVDDVPSNEDVIDPCVYVPDHILIPPNSFALAETMEYIHMPDNMLAIVLGKSTYARCGLILNCTPIEPSWFGKVTLEISNTTPLPARIYAAQGIGQILFFESSEKCEKTYATKEGGKYQGQEGLTLPLVS